VLVRGEGHAGDAGLAGVDGEQYCALAVAEDVDLAVVAGSGEVAAVLQVHDAGHCRRVQLHLAANAPALAVPDDQRAAPVVPAGTHQLPVGGQRADVGLVACEHVEQLLRGDLVDPQDLVLAADHDHPPLAGEHSAQHGLAVLVRIHHSGLSQADVLRPLCEDVLLLHAHPEHLAALALQPAHVVVPPAWPTTGLILPRGLALLCQRANPLEV
jgi:hypothetical protein